MIKRNKPISEFILPPDLTGVWSFSYFEWTVFLYVCIRKWVRSM